MVAKFPKDWNTREKLFPRSSECRLKRAAKERSYQTHNQTLRPWRSLDRMFAVKALESWLDTSFMASILHVILQDICVDRKEDVECLCLSRSRVLATEQMSVCTGHWFQCVMVNRLMIWLAG